MKKIINKEININLLMSCVGFYIEDHMTGREGELKKEKELLNDLKNAKNCLLKTYLKDEEVIK